jgi:anti-sigma factor RsiW
MSTPDPITTTLGAYVLGTLDASEHAVVKNHLAECAPCSEERTRLAWLPELLAQLDTTDLHFVETGGLGPDDRLVDRALVALAQRRSRVPGRVRLLTAAAGIALVAAAATLGFQQHNRSQDTFDRKVSATNAVSGIHAVLQLRREPWGTALRLSLNGLPSGTHCHLVAVLTNGQRQNAGTWQSTYERPANISAAADARPDQLTSIDVMNDRGVRLISVPLAPR